MNPVVDPVASGGGVLVGHSDLGADLPNTCVPVGEEAPVGPRVWVFGAARSGNTLLNQLLAGFGLDTMPGETCLGRLLAHPSTGVVAGKRTLHCARHLPKDPVPDGLTVLHLVRDPRDVITSRLEPYDGYYCGLERWIRDENAIAAYRARGGIVTTLRFEDLVTEPSAVQGTLEAVLGVAAHRGFHEYGRTWAPERVDVESVGYLGGVRPLDSALAGRWLGSPEHRQRVRAELARWPAAEAMLTTHGYTSTARLLAGV